MGLCPSSVPQGTKLGPGVFLILINGLNICNRVNIKLWKYVGDMTGLEVVHKDSDSNAQQIANRVANWSFEKRVKLNHKKCKELRISFAKSQPEFQPILVSTLIQAG